MISLSHLASHECQISLPEAYRRVFEKVRSIPAVLPESVRKDRADLFDLSLSVSMFLTAWGSGDEQAIQNAVELMAEWTKSFNDRKAAEALAKKAVA